MTKAGLAINDLRSERLSQVHSSWISAWATGFSDENLIDRLVSNPRFSARILSFLDNLVDAPTSFSETEFSKLQNRITHLTSDKQLRRIGLAWFAPRISRCLFNPETRLTCGDLDRQNIADIFEFKDHCVIDDLSALPNAEGLRDEGAHCLLAWVKNYEPEAFERARLFVPRSEWVDHDNDLARADLFLRFLNANSGVS